MNIWLIGESVLVLALVTALWKRERLSGHFQVVSMVLCISIMATCLLQSVLDGPRPWTLALGALALVCFGVEVVRQRRYARRPRSGA